MTTSTTPTHLRRRRTVRVLSGMLAAAVTASAFATTPASAGPATSLCWSAKLGWYECGPRFTTIPLDPSLAETAVRP